MKTAQGSNFTKVLQQIVDSACSATPNSLKTSLLPWCAQNYYHHCEALIKAKADIGVTQTGGKTLLHLASLAGAHHAIHYLLEQKVPVNFQDEAGKPL